MPVGMHRPQASRWKNVWPFLVILVLVPLFAWGASAFLMKRQSETVASAEQSTPVVQQSAQQSEQEPQSDQSARSAQSEQSAQSAQSAQTAQSAQSIPEPEPTPEPEAQVNFSASIAVLNGTARAGLAGARASVLNGAGFTQTSAANADGWATQVTTVFYVDPAFEATAKEVAKALDIAQVEQASNIGDADIAVVLK